MNLPDIFRRAMCVFCVILSSLSVAIAQTATWTGAANDNQWSNPANWSWSTGSGLPTASTNVIVHNINFNTPINIGPNFVASCKDLTIDGGNSNQIEIGANSKLNVYGSIVQNGPHNYLSDASIASGAAGSELLFSGGQTQVLKSVMIYMSKVRVNKSGGNVVVDSFCRLFISDTLFLESMPVAIGIAAKGNLEIRHGSLIRDVHGAVTKLPVYTEAQIPPHIICTQYPVTVGDEVSYIVGDILSDAGLEQGINGTILFPVGRNDSSYTPVSVTQTGTNTNAWNVHITAPEPASCSANPVSGTQAVKHGFNVVPLERNLSSTVSVIGAPATISLSYNTANSRDVPAGFNAANNSKSAYRYNQMQGCWDKLSTSSQSGNNFKTVTITNCTSLEQFAIASSGSLGVPDQERVQSLSIFPNPVSSIAKVKIGAGLQTKVVLRVIDFTGRELSQSTHELSKGEQVLSIDMSGLPAGTYTLLLEDADGNRSSSVMVKQ